MSSELKVGALFFLGLGLVTTFVFVFSNAFHSHGAFRVRFDHIQRLKVGDEVTYNGVKVGTVTSIQPAVVKGPQGATPTVEIEFSVDSSMRDSVLVSKDSEYRIDMGLLGGSALAIVSTGGDAIHPTEGEPPKGVSPVTLDETVSGINKVIAENKDDLHSAIAGARAAIGRIGDMAEQIRALVAENRPHISTAITNIGGASGSIRDLVEANKGGIGAAISSLKDLSRHLDELVGENREMVRKMIANFASAGEQVTAAAKSIAEVVSENRQDIHKAIHGIGEAAPRLDRIGSNLELITGQIAAGKGTIGKLVMDDSLHDKAMQTLESVNSRMEELKPVTGPLASLKIWGGIESGMNTRTQVTDTYAYLRLEPRPWKFYSAGVSYRTAPKGLIAAPENPDTLHVDFNIQLGWRFFSDDADQIYRVTVAGGLIDSQLGGWAEAPIIPHWLDVYVMARQKDNQRQPDDRRYEHGNALMRAYVAANLYHNRIFVNLGGDDLLDRAGFWIGVRGELLDNDLRNMVTLAGLAP
jgi:ABC-type transporter Mla subunit MlaD